MNMINKNKILLLSLLLVITSNTIAMERPVVRPQDETLIEQLSQAVQAKDFECYFTLLEREPIEKQKELCQAVLTPEKSIWGGEVDAPQSRDKQAIHYAAKQGNAAAIKRLLDLGAAIDARGQYGMTPLLIACQAGHLSVLTVLLERGADKTATDNNGLSALHLAADSITDDHEKAAIIASLLKDTLCSVKSADQWLSATVDARTPRGIVLARNDCLSEFVLRSVGAQLNERETEQFKGRGLCFSLLKNEVSKQEMLEAISKKSLAPWDPNTIDSNDHTTFLMKAVTNSCLSCVELLLKDKRTNPNIPDNTGETPLHLSAYAMNANEFAICSLLLSLQRTNPILKDNYGKTARERLEAQVEEDKKKWGLSLSAACALKYFNLRRMRVNLYLSLLNARCSEQCSEPSCWHVPHLPADICMKIARLLTESSLPCEKIQETAPIIAGSTAFERFMAGLGQRQ